MHTTLQSALSALLLLAPPLAAAATLTLRIAPAPNFHQEHLPPQTHATLATLGAAHDALLTPAGEFVFHNVSEGSYLADVHCATHAFAPLRVDVAVGAAEGGGERVLVQAWETYRGNDWGNKGEIAARDGANGVVEVRMLGFKNYFMERPAFSVFSILKNPMILLGLVSMGLFIGMPYLVENMDPEMRAEFEERQKTNPMNSILSGQQAGPSPLGDFDMAGFLAGSSKKEEGGAKKAGDNGGVRR